MKIPSKLVIAGIVLLLLIFSVIFICVIINEGAKRDIAAMLEEIKSSGGAFEDLIPAPVPPEENAATLYNEAFDLLEEGTPEEKTSMVAVSGGGWAEEHAENVLSLLAKNEKALRLVHEASRRKACNFDVDYSLILTSLVSHYSEMRQCARLLTLEALAKQREGDLDGAFESCIACLRMAHAISNEPMLISGLVVKSIESVGMSALDKVVADGRCKEVQLWAVLKEVQRLEASDPGLKLALQGERCLMTATYSAATGDPNQLGGFPSPGFVGFGGPLRPLLKPFLRRDEVRYLKIMDRYIRAMQLSYPEAKSELNAIDADIKALPRLSVAKIALPAFMGLYDVQFRHDARWKLAELALAIKIYRLRNGDFPKSLDALSPGILKAIPKDPFTEKDFIYRRDAESVIVYSVGQNCRDDNGLYIRVQPEMGDIVWTIKR